MGLGVLKNKLLPEAALTIAEDERDQTLMRERQERVEKEATLKREAELRQHLKDAKLG